MPIVAQEIAQEDISKAIVVAKHRGSRTLRFNPKNFVFYTVFFLVFCFSGLITILNIVPYRMAAVASLIIPLFLFYKFRFDRVFLAFLLLVFLIILSGVINGVPLKQQGLFIAGIAFAFLIYYLVRIFITRDNAAKVIRLCVVVGMIQLPVIIIQLLSYDFLKARIYLPVHRIDFDFGTFNFKTDASMTFFLILLIIFLLFDKERNYIIKHRWLVIGWLSITVLITNSEIMKLMLVGIWAVYLLRYFKLRNLIRFGILLLFITLLLYSTGVLDEIISDSMTNLRNNLELDANEMERFLSGGYGRRAAIAYYLNSEVELLGDGPGEYYDRLAKVRVRGNTGHIFSYYAEIGLLGLLTTVLIFFLIAFTGSKTRFRISLVAVLMLISVQFLSITTFIINDISVVLGFTIFSMAYLIPKRKDLGSLPAQALGNNSS